MWREPLDNLQPKVKSSSAVFIKLCSAESLGSVRYEYGFSDTISMTDFPSVRNEFLIYSRTFHSVLNYLCSTNQWKNCREDV
jgi:hypothetical protein